MTLVSDLIRRKQTDVITVQSTTDVASTVHLLMTNSIGGVPVVSAEGVAVGFVAERDIVKALESNREQTLRLPVQQIMRHPAPTCGAEDSLRDVMARMTRDRLRHLVVIEAGRVAGVLSVGDIVKYRLEQLETEAGVLRDYVAAQRAAT